MNWAKGRGTRGRGTSFKGTFQYVMHDKGAKTAERVGFVDVRNLAADTPDQAWREMMALCDAADELKARAGIKTRRPLRKPVYAFTLNWHALDEPDEAHMRETAADALRALGMEHLQAVIVQHTDTPHRHVHVIVNLVDPETGKAAPLSNDNHKLDRWADNYEVGMGMIRSPERRAKFHAFDNGLKPPKRAQQAISREEWESRKIKGEQAKKRADDIRAAYAACVAQLKATQGDAYLARKAEAAKLWNAYQADRKAIRDRYRPFIDAIWTSRRRTPPHPFTEQVLRDLEETAEWKELGRRQWKDRRLFNARETSLLGVIANTVRLHQMRRDATGWDLLKLIASRRSRIDQFNRMQQGQKQTLRQRQAQSRRVRADALKAAQRVEIAGLAGEFAQRREDMAARHNAEIAAQKAAWRQLAADRQKVWTDYRKAFGLPEPQQAPVDERSPIVRQFDVAAKGCEQRPPQPDRQAPAPDQPGWRARRSAAERKADGSYRPRSRDPDRSRNRRNDPG